MNPYAGRCGVGTGYRLQPLAHRLSLPSRLLVSHVGCWLYRGGRDRPHTGADLVLPFGEHCGNGAVGFYPGPRFTEPVWADTAVMEKVEATE